MAGRRCGSYRNTCPRSRAAGAANSRRPGFTSAPTSTTGGTRCCRLMAETLDGNAGPWPVPVQCFLAPSLAGCKAAPVARVHGRDIFMHVCAAHIDSARTIVREPNIVTMLAGNTVTSEELEREH